MIANNLRVLAVLAFFAPLTYFSFIHEMNPKVGKCYWGRYVDDNYMLYGSKNILEVTRVKRTQVFYIHLVGSEISAKDRDGYWYGTSKKMPLCSRIDDFMKENVEIACPKK